MSSFQKLFEESTCLWNYIFHHPGNDVFLLCWLFPVWCLLGGSGHHGVSGCSLVSMGCWQLGSRNETKVHVLHAWIGSLLWSFMKRFWWLRTQRFALSLRVLLWKHPISVGELVSALLSSTDSHIWPSHIHGYVGLWFNEGFPAGLGVWEEASSRVKYLVPLTRFWTGQLKNRCGALSSESPGIF